MTNEDEKKAKESIGAWIDPESKKWLVDHNITISRLVNRLIKEYIEKEEHNEHH